MKFLQTFGKELATITLLGVIVWVGIYLWRATPLLMYALGPAAVLIAAFWTVFFLGSAFLFVCAALAWLWIMLNDQHHLYETKKRYREENLRQQALKQQYMLVDASACLTCCCSNSVQNNTN